MGSSLAGEFNADYKTPGSESGRERPVVPAVMQLLGKRNWWIPNWLERSPPRLDVERVALGTAEARP